MCVHVCGLKCVYVSVERKEGAGRGVCGHQEKKGGEGATKTKHTAHNHPHIREQGLSGDDNADKHHATHPSGAW